MNNAELSEDVAKGYAGYFKLDNSSFIAQLDCEVDAMQKLMDELYTTLLTLQESNTEVLDVRLAAFMEKAKLMESVFMQIDIVQEAVSKISLNVSQLEGAATVVDKQLDSNPLKKMFGFFKGNSEKQNETVDIPSIFDSETLFSCASTALNPSIKDKGVAEYSLNSAEYEMGKS